MKNSSLSDTRTGFLDFFRRHGHEVLPSSPLVPHNDPTLMFTNAGMNQFKNIFTGAEKAPYKRAATSQKVVRAGGKHNDLDNVGYTARHHTFFEMLGNFSFGDYFKELAIPLAWELLTSKEYYGLAKDKLTFTVYHTDDEAFHLWKKVTGCDERRILRVPTKDNFWAMGDTGPCGPCSEIFYDHGEKAGEGQWALNPDGSDRFGGRYVEIWNLVFMQFEQLPPPTPPASGGGELVPLPKPSIDTGMGLERIAAVLQGVHDNYEIDLFRNLIATIKEESRVVSRESRNNDTRLEPRDSSHAIAYRVIADHLRSTSFLIADGVMPSNEGRGYVLRRIMRRAMRYAHQIGCRDPLMHRLVPSLVREMGDQYPELKRAFAVITETLKNEEERFKQTLERGLKLLEEEMEKMLPLEGGADEASPNGAKLSRGGERLTPHGSAAGKALVSPAPPQGGSGTKLPGDVAFKLYDTYGFPLDLTQDILRGRGMEVDVAGFDAAMDKQKDMARAAWSGSGEKAVGRLWFDLKEKVGATEFVGYEQDVCDAKVIALIEHGKVIEAAHTAQTVSIILDRTPFYGESGGQVGDHGSIYKNGKVVAHVLGTQKPLEDFHVQNSEIGPDQVLRVGDTVIAEIDAPRRARIRANHSATHLMHKALREVLGEHVSQKGSYVGPDRLRFDFSHGKAMTREEIAAVEAKVNAAVWRNTPVECKVMASDEAIQAGAMALFGEKYGDRVRVLSMGIASRESRVAQESQNDRDSSHATRATPYSVELCGGTHVRATGDIGLFKIVSEGAVAAGIRRIEALTGEGAFAYLAQQEATLRDLAQSLKIGMDVLPERVAQLSDEKKKLEKDLADAKKKLAMGGGGNAVGTVAEKEKIGDVDFIPRIFDDMPPKELRGIAETFLKNADPKRGVAVAASGFEGKASLVVAVSQGLADTISAVSLVQAAVAELGGKGGGGRPDMAQGGGPDASKLPEAVEAVRCALRAKAG